MFDKPHVLGRGARLAVIAPSSPFAREEFNRGLDELRGLGFEPIVDDRIFERSGYVAGPASLRVAVIHEALRNPGIDALIAVRGGHGSAHLLPLLDQDLVRLARKAIIGHSDLTAVLQVVTLACRLIAVHGPMVAGSLAKGDSAYHRQSFLGALTSSQPLGELQPEGLEIIVPGEAIGPLLGGTLTHLCSGLGTPFAFSPPPGFILLVDEINERPYRLDRMLTQLRLSGILARAAGVVFGDLPGCDEPAGGLTAKAAVAAVLKGIGVPVVWGFPTGHAISTEWTLPLGLPVRVVASGPAPMLVFDEPATSG